MMFKLINHWEWKNTVLMYLKRVQSPNWWRIVGIMLTDMFGLSQSSRFDVARVPQNPVVDDHFPH
jgi:hypothetical protein